MSALSNNDIIEIKNELYSKKSAKRRSAAKKIKKYNIVSLKEVLLDRYLEERKDTRTWETQSEMINALGRIGCKEAIPFLKEIIDKNEDMDTITFYATLSYIRLTRDGQKDISDIIFFMDKGGHSVFDGAVSALAYDDIVPSEEEQKKILDILENRTVYDDPYVYPTQRIISFMCKWSNDLICDFLDHYARYPQYGHFIENTLAGKKSCKE